MCCATLAVQLELPHRPTPCCRPRRLSLCQRPPPGQAQQLGQPPLQQRGPSLAPNTPSPSRPSRCAACTSSTHLQGSAATLSMVGSLVHEMLWPASEGARQGVQRWFAQAVIVMQGCKQHVSATGALRCHHYHCSRSRCSRRHYKVSYMGRLSLCVGHCRSWGSRCPRGAAGMVRLQRCRPLQWPGLPLQRQQRLRPRGRRRPSTSPTWTSPRWVMACVIAVGAFLVTAVAEMARHPAWHCSSLKPCRPAPCIQAHPQLAPSTSSCSPRPVASAPNLHS